MSERMSFFRDDSQSLRTHISFSDISTPHEGSKILVIDDDPIFCRMMERIGVLKGITIVTISSFKGSLKVNFGEFDAAIMDYMLDNDSTGLDVAAKLSGDMYSLPVILVSHTGRVPGTSAWPSAVREFIHKNFGPHVILDAAIEASDIAKLQRNIGSRL